MKIPTGRHFPGGAIDWAVRRHLIRFSRELRSKARRVLTADIGQVVSDDSLSLHAASAELPNPSLPHRRHRLAARADFTPASRRKPYDRIGGTG